jgi:three-Cys-motif partner protein
MCRVRSAIVEPRFVWGSALLALRNQPKLERSLLLEIGRRQSAVLGKRTASFERASLYRGNANTALVNVVRDKVPARAPCFCLLDPPGMQLQWETIRQLAAIPGRPRKPELLITFPLRMAILRQLTVTRQIGRAAAALVSASFGTEEWRAIYGARLRGEVSPARAKDAYLELFEGRVRQLGYRSVRSKAIVAPRVLGGARQEMYHLIFATDHPAGDEIMQDVFERPYFLDFPNSAQRSLF